MANFELTEAIEFLRNRLALPEDIWETLLREAGMSARARSADMTEAMHKDILKAIIKALEDGTTLQTFQQDFVEIAQKHGWTGDRDFGFRTSLIFQTQITQAQAAGKWREIQTLKPQYLRYVAIMDNRVRPEHAAWHGTILPVDHPWWKTHFPPNGFNCRCSVMSIDDRDLKRFGWEVSEQAPPLNMVERHVKDGDDYHKVMVPKGVDPGFNFNIGEVGLNLPSKR